MALLVDTSVWSLAYRRGTPPDLPEVEALRRALTSGDSVVTTGIILLELLRGFAPPKAQQTIRAAFDVLEFIEPDRDDYLGAAAVGHACRSSGVHLSSVDALIARLAMAGGHTVLTTDRDLHLAGEHVDLRVWRPPKVERPTR